MFARFAEMSLYPILAIVAVSLAGALVAGVLGCELLALGFMLLFVRR